jgi:ureidoacrylate peracid hydrolase
MANLTYEKEITALLVVDPYNDFISEGGKIWDRIKPEAEANKCVPNMLQVLNAARKAGLRVFYAMHRRYRQGNYETWKYIAPIQKRAWQSQVFEYGTSGGEIRSEFQPKPGVKTPDQMMLRLSPESSRSALVPQIVTELQKLE